MKSDPFFYQDSKEDEVLNLNAGINFDVSAPRYSYMFDNLALLNSKSDIRSKVKASFKLSYVVLIIIAHLTLVATINIPIHGLDMAVPSHKKTLLKATLYTKKALQVNAPAVQPFIRKNTITQAKSTDITKYVSSKIKMPINKIHKDFSKAINKNIVSSIKSPKTKGVLHGQSLAEQSLSKLNASINEHAVVQASRESYNEYLEDKNSVDKSNNKFYPDYSKIKEIKLKSTSVDCNSAIKKNIVRLSGLMGGRVRCYSSPSLKNFLKSRNKH